MIQRGTALIVLCLGVLAGCGGGSGGGGGVGTPALQLAASPAVIAAGDRSTISWTATDAATCEASGGWSGTRPTSGTFVTPALTAATTFTLSCAGPTGGVVARATVDIQDPSKGAPNVALASSPASIPVNGTATLKWTATNASSCQASGGWSGARSLTGSQAVSGLARDTSYSLSCSGPGGTGVAMTQVVLQRATLRWETPQLASGATLSGFRVQWGSSPGSYSTTINIADPNARARAIDLPGPGTYYFAMAALDAAGNETARSNEASKVIPG